MRAPEVFEYVIDKLPTPQEIFNTIQHYGERSDKEMYSEYNMGAGFAVYVGKESVEDVIAHATRNGFKAFHAGHVRASDKKRVVIEPKGITFEKEDLAIR